MSFSLIAELQDLVKKTSDRPRWEEYFMSVALLISTRSSCERLKVGCILVSSKEQGNRILASGYNGVLAGAPHLSYIRDDHEQGNVHAEQNAVTDAARRGISIDGATAYITHFPCINCAKILAAAGIKKIIYLNDYKNDPLVKELLNQWDIELSSLSLS